MQKANSLIVNDQIQLCRPDLSMSTALFELINDNRTFLNQYITFAQNKKNLKAVQAFLKEIINFNFGGQKYNLVIKFQDSIAGIIGFHRINPQDAKAEIGYWIGESFQGQGILSKSMPVFLHHGFEVFGINRVELITLTQHRRSIALAERTGFKKEGVLRESYFMHDQFHDAAIYSSLKSEFLASYIPPDF